LRLAIAATKPQGRICIVADDRQAIYGFRGADSGGLDRLKAELRAAELGLKTTYRCPREVVALAQEFVSDFRAAPTAPAGEVISLDATDKLIVLAKPGDFVLSRVNAPLASICLDLIRVGKKAYVKGSEFGREVAKLVDKLVAAERLSLPALSARLGEWYKVECRRLEALSTRAAAAKLSRTNNQYELLWAFLMGSKDYRDLREKIEATFADIPNPGAIMCSTVHKAKGLEAPHVFLLSGTFSRDDFSDDHTSGHCEEDNICYVAITRAKETLYIVGETAHQFAMTPEQVRNEMPEYFLED
jgi:superfamily I DNA/RNA helicase